MADAVAKDVVAEEATAADDVDMSEAVAETQEEAPAADGGEAGDVEVTEAPAEAEPEEEEKKPKGFIDYLSSPIVSLVVGNGSEDSVVLSAHQALLEQSPYFARLVSEFTDDSDRRIDLSQEQVDAVGCFLEYLYTGEYFPRKLVGHAHQLEPDPAQPDVDETGAQLLKHARIYTIASTFELPALQTLASSKIHCVNSTAKGEIEFARYVYKYTPTDDTVVRRPVAKFWATRSHTLRAEAEKEFQALCLEFPQFAYDVLTRVLDEKLKRERDDKMYPPSQGSARKRARSSAHT